MPTDEIINRVGDDVLNGLGPVFEPVGEGFVVRKGFARGIGDDDLAAVPWEYSCRHTGDFQGVLPTGRVLTIEGVTIVDRRGPDEQYSRYIDWSAVFVQLGMQVSTRVTVTEDEYAFGRARFAQLHTDGD